VSSHRHSTKGAPVNPHAVAEEPLWLSMTPAIPKFLKCLYFFIMNKEESVLSWMCCLIQVTCPEFNLHFLHFLFFQPYLIFSLSSATAPTPIPVPSVRATTRQKSLCLRSSCGPQVQALCRMCSSQSAKKLYQFLDLLSLSSVVVIALGKDTLCRV
jgi:hypothetical protein